MSGRTGVIGVGLLAGSVWVGSLVCLAIVARVARRQLDESSNVVLFRDLGQVYGRVGTGALATAVAAGLVLAWPLPEASGTALAALGVGVALAGLTAMGMAQAKRMTLRRQRLLAAPEDPGNRRAVDRGAAVAVALRGSMGLATLVALVLVASLLDS